MKLPPLVTVVVTHFEQHHLLERALSSVFLQKIPSLQVILVDDGSEQPPEITLNVPAHIDFKFIVQKNTGVAGARNHGIRYAQAAWVKFLDADDELCPGCLESQISSIQGSNHAVSIIGYKLTQGGNETLGVPKFDDYFSACLLGNVAPLHAFLYPLKIVQAIGGFDESARTLSAMEDYDFNLRIALLKPRAITVHETGVCYHRLPGSRSSYTPRVHEANVRILKNAISELQSSGELNEVSFEVLNGIIQMAYQTSTFAPWISTLKILHPCTTPTTQERSWAQLKLLISSRLEGPVNEVQKSFWHLASALCPTEIEPTRQLAEPSYGYRPSNKPLASFYMEPVLLSHAIAEAEKMDNLWLWGAGVWAEIWLQVLHPHGIRPKGVIESSPSETTKYGYNIHTPSEALKLGCDSVIICSRDSYFQIEKAAQQTLGQVTIINYVSL